MKAMIAIVIKIKCESDEKERRFPCFYWRKPSSMESTKRRDKQNTLMRASNNVSDNFQGNAQIHFHFRIASVMRSQIKT